MADSKKTTSARPAAKATGNQPAPGLRQEVSQPLGGTARVKGCTVKGCPNRTTPGDEICSAHAMHYHRDGTKRQTGPIQQPGAVAVDG